MSTDSSIETTDKSTPTSSPSFKNRRKGLQFWRNKKKSDDKSFLVMSSAPEKTNVAVEQIEDKETNATGEVSTPVSEDLIEESLQQESITNNSSSLLKQNTADNDMSEQEVVKRNDDDMDLTKETTKKPTIKSQKDLQEERQRICLAYLNQLRVKHDQLPEKHSTKPKVFESNCDKDDDSEYSLLKSPSQISVRTSRRSDLTFNRCCRIPTMPTKELVDKLDQQMTNSTLMKELEKVFFDLLFCFEDDLDTPSTVKTLRTSSIASTVTSLRTSSIGTALSAPYYYHQRSFGQDSIFDFDGELNEREDPKPPHPDQETSSTGMDRIQIALKTKGQLK